VVNTFGGVIFTLVAISVVIIYNNRRIQSKKQLLMNQQDELARQNLELINSREEIAAQRDILAAQNQELKEARSIIEQQNLEIKLRNERLEDDVNERTRALSDYNEQLEQFAFISAHNLRAPVARILGLGELLKHNPDGHDQPVIVQKMIATTHELDEVVRHLNMILNIQHDSSISITAIDVAEEAQEIKHKLHEAIKISGAAFIESYAQAPVCFAMKPYFENILHTLLENAIRYRNPERSPVIRITTSVHDGYFCLEVEDNGLGIDLAQFRNKLFTLYSRFHFHVEGRGIGLYLLKTQVNALKGRIEIESTVDQGTVFRIYFIHSDPVMRRLLNQVVSETRSS
jgi:signal transduction histidine kinase